MPLVQTTMIPPARRADLLLRPLGDDGQHVVKDLCSGTYFSLPPVETFLLEQLDGQHTIEEICTAFEQRFREPLGADDLDQFLAVAREQGLLQPTEAPAPESAALIATAPPASSGHRWAPLVYAEQLLYFR